MFKGILFYINQIMNDKWTTKKVNKVKKKKKIQIGIKRHFMQAKYPKSQDTQLWTA